MDSHPVKSSVCVSKEETGHSFTGTAARWKIVQLAIVFCQTESVDLER